MVSELRHCANGHEVSGTTSLCPTCGDGRVTDGHEGEDGVAAGGWSYIVVGLLLVAVGTALLAGAEAGNDSTGLLGVLVVAAGGMVAGIGVVAQGVLVGLRRWHHESERTSR